jgi:hypothetical protein
MTKHKFNIGQKVDFTSRMRAAAASGEFEVMRLLPAEGGELQYRIKSPLERTERVVAEDQLAQWKTRETAG